MRKFNTQDCLILKGLHDLFFSYAKDGRDKSFASVRSNHIH